MKRGITYFLGGKAYDFLDEYFERTRYKKIRANTLKSLEQKILDAGCGTGKNFPHYPAAAEVLAVDNSESMLKAARLRVDGKNIKIAKMELTRLSLQDNSIDAVVATFVLCTMSPYSERKALKELIRVAKPGARLYFLEYVYSKNFLRKVAMKMTSFIPKLLYGIRFDSTLPVLEEEPLLEIEKTEFVYEDVLRLIVARKKSRKMKKERK